MKLKNVAMAGLVLALGAVVPLALADEKSPPHLARAYAFHFDDGGSWLGVSIEDIDSARAKELGLEREMGAEVKEVHSGSPAEEADLQAGDVILRYQEMPVQGVRQLTRLVRETPAGRTVSLEVFRSGSTLDVKAKVTEQKSSWKSNFEVEKFMAPGFELGEIEIPDIDISGIEAPDVEIRDVRVLGGRYPVRLGASIGNLTQQLGDFFGVENGEGVLVREVEDDSPGDRAGLRAGDVIVGVDDETITNTRELRRALRERQDVALLLTVVRDRQEKKLKVEPPEREDDEAISSEAPPAPPVTGVSVM